ncbi:hypothetical protein ICW40_12265, partial [Actinotalea ferrariae]|uniref:hypothetical protein n=1 Tax=Actinotalea ferrariae TaxID=1386098 RepID=UPI001C8B9B7E
MLSSPQSSGPRDAGPPPEDLPYDVSYDDEPPYDPEYDAAPPPGAGWAAPAASGGTGARRAQAEASA